MTEPEKLIWQWRLEMIRALPGGEDVIAELEDHLRVRVASLAADGCSPSEAFSQAVAELGSPSKLGPQFSRVMPKQSKTMKTVRIVLTVIIGAYLGAMGLQFIAICCQLFRNNTSPFSNAAPAAFFTNGIACVVSAATLWLLWRRRTRHVSMAV